MGGKRSIISLIIVCLIGCMLCGCDKKQDTEKRGTQLAERLKELSH